MAQIMDYLKEKEKRANHRGDYDEKIKKHKLSILYRLLIIAAVLVAIILLIVFQYRRHIYTGYDIVNKVVREKAVDASDMRLQNSVLTYSKDGAHCTNSKGTVTWNQTYEISDIKIAACQNVVAIGDYNGRNIFVQSADKVLGNITTNRPIKNIAVSASGIVTAVLEDTDVTWINTYDTKDGTSLFSGQAHMSESGYPCALSLTPNGELLAVSYLFVEAGNIKTNIAFYNLGAVGANRNDYLVGTFFYENVLVPEIHFMNDDTAFAVGDDRLLFFKGSQVPENDVVRILNQRVHSVYYSDKYVGLVFLSDDPEHYYKMEVYNTSGILVTEYYFDLDYTDIFFEQDNFVIYNETECIVCTMGGVCKYRGEFDGKINLMLPSNGRYKYMLITDNAIDTIQLK